MDGINLGLILMGAVVLFAAVCVSRQIKTREKEFYILLLLMGGGILGAFASLDLFFFLFLPRTGAGADLYHDWRLGRGGEQELTPRSKSRFT